jgi:hypothetical protein
MLKRIKDHPSYIYFLLLFLLMILLLFFKSVPNGAEEKTSSGDRIKNFDLSTAFIKVAKQNY